MTVRRKQVSCGGILIGGYAPISIQSMTNIDSRDEVNLLRQVLELEEAGADIVRIAVPDMESVGVFERIKKKVKLPLVADIHFDYRLAIEAIKAGADKIRINPGNIGNIDRVKKVVDCAKERGIPIRVGVNSGSLEKDILAKYDGRVTAEGLAESALKNLKLIENMGYDKLVVSLKASDVAMNYEAHKIVARECDYPIHIGITEAGTLENGKIKSAIGIGALFLNGIGDTMRVSLTANPVEEIYFAKGILKNLGIRKGGIDYISCPTCGRTRVNLEELVREIETELKPIDDKLSLQGRQIKVAVMGCAVNGPGEARGADYGLACGDGKAIIFKAGEIVESVSASDATSHIYNMITKEIV